MKKTFGEILNGFVGKKWDRKDYLRRYLGDFADENKDMLIIVADPKTDYIFCAYRGKNVLGQIKSLDGSKMRVVKNLLSASAMSTGIFNKFIGYFLASLIDVLAVPVQKGNQFYQFLDGAIYNIVREIYNPKPKKVEDKTLNSAEAQTTNG